MFVPLLWEAIEFLYILEKTAAITPFFQSLTNNEVQKINFMMLTHCHELCKPVSIMILVNLALALVNLLLKKVLNEGMDYMSIITYRQAISFIFMAPIACILLMLFRVTFPQYLFLLGLEYTSATFSCAFLNMVPVFTFIMALPFGIEKVNMQSKCGKAKVMGTFVCIGGALLLVLYKGMPLIKSQSQHIGTPPTAKLETWIIGSIVLTVGCLLWSSWFIIQAKISKKYPCQYSSTAILSLFAAIQSAILTLIIKKNNASWILKGKLEIISVIYAGLVGSGLCYVAMSWCVKQRGPVFTAAFTPLIQIFVAMLDFSVLKEEIYMGSVAGSALVIAGMYILLWGKSKEEGEHVLKDTQTSQDVESQ